MKYPRIKFLLPVLGVVFLLYPLLVYWSMQRFEPRYIGVGVLLFYLLRLFIQSNNLMAKKLILVGFLMAVIGVWVLNSEMLLLLMPVIINFIVALIFAHSYLEPPTIPAKFAAKIEGTLNNRQIAYTNKVTLVWIAFMVLNGTVALYTVLFSSKEVWMLYNGLVAYILMGTLFGLEFLYRHFIFYGKKS